MCNFWRCCSRDESVKWVCKLKALVMRAIMMLETVCCFFVYNFNTFWRLFWHHWAPSGTIGAVLEAICVLNGSIEGQAFFHGVFWTFFFIQVHLSGELWVAGFGSNSRQKCHWKYKYCAKKATVPQIYWKAQKLMILHWCWSVFSFKNIINNESVAQSEYLSFVFKNPDSRPPKGELSGSIGCFVASISQHKPLPGGIQIAPFFHVENSCG